MSQQAAAAAAAAPGAGRKASARDPKHQLLHALAGAGAGAFSKTLLQPLDLLKTRMQVQDPAAGAYRGVLHGIRSIYASGGVVGFYAGLGPNLVGSAASWGVQFYTFHTAKRFLRSLQSDPQAPLHPLHNMAAGGSASVASVLVTNPIWMIKTRVQVQGERYRGLLPSLAKTVREEGVLSLYRGVGPALLLVSNGALQFMAYEELRQWAARALGGGEGEAGLSGAHFLALGAASKAFSGTLTYPLQVVRSRLYQHADAPGAAAPSRRPGAKFAGAREVLAHVWRTQGARGFYKGWLPQMLKTAPGNAITMAAYEQLMRWFQALS
jgi:solute carrier family 25 folate transporter 32